MVINLVAALLLFFGLSFASSGEPTLIQEFPIPEEAYGIQRIELGQSGDAQQLLFRMNLPYPSTQAIEFYEEYFMINGWQPCVDANQGWAVFDDNSDDEALSVHQFMDHWIHEGRHRLLILSATYYSNGAGLNSPSEDEQIVSVWVQEGTDFQEETERLSIRCQ